MNDSKTILVIEDDKKIAASLTVVLKSAGYEVLVAHDAVMGLGMAVKHQPDLVLTDIWMPAGDGFRIADRMKGLSDTTGIPTVFMTASKKPGIVEEVEKAGAVAFLEKPFEKQVLLDTVRNALGSTPPDAPLEW